MKFLAQMVSKWYQTLKYSIQIRTQKKSSKSGREIFSQHCFEVFSYHFLKHCKIKRKKLGLIFYIGAGYKGTTSKGLSPNLNLNLRKSKHINFFL